MSGCPLCQDTPPVSILPLFPASYYSLLTRIIGDFTVKLFDSIVPSLHYLADRCRACVGMMVEPGWEGSGLSKYGSRWEFYGSMRFRHIVLVNLSKEAVNKNKEFLFLHPPYYHWTETQHLGHLAQWKTIEHEDWDTVIPNFYDIVRETEIASRNIDMAKGRILGGPKKSTSTLNYNRKFSLHLQTQSRTSLYLVRIRASSQTVHLAWRRDRETAIYWRLKNISSGPCLYKR